MNSHSPQSSVLNAVLYQLGWFACVLGAAWDRAGLGATLAIGLALLHLLLAERPGREWPLMVSAAALGLILDTFHARAGILDFRGHQAGTIAPLWIIALWLQFATVLHFCLRWLSRRYGLAFVVGLIGGPLAFVGGERLGAAVFGDPRPISLAVLGLSWGLALPLLVWIADRLGGIGRYRIFPRLLEARA